jgi:polyhydroxybutyrate depolymerase
VKKYKVDDSQIFIVGWSNGGHMAYRLACEMSDRIAGIASFAGYMALKDFSN